MHIHFKNQVAVKNFSEELISLDYQDSNLEWKMPTVSLQMTLKTLLEGGEVEDVLLQKWDVKESNLFYFLIEKLKQKGWLSYTLYNKGFPFCTLNPYKGSQFRLKSWKNRERAFQISRFAYMRHDEGQILLETPLAPVSIQIHNPLAAALWASLASPITLEKLKEQFTDLDGLESFIALLHGACFIEAEDASLDTWEFHDLVFHSRSRRGRNPKPAGATFRFLDKKPPLSPLKAFSEETAWHPLYVPDLFSNKMTLSEALEKRCSIRDQGQRNIDLKELGEFLYRVARVKKEKKAQNYEATERPYPGGGACYELEIYPLINRCSEIEKGLYYYHPQKHALTSVCAWNSDLEEILASATLSSARIERPQIVFLIASRFGRLSWKYQSMAYATTLKDTGVLMQTMYLVATAMNLAPCAIGGGNSDLFSKVAKTNYYEETTVGEFLLGTKNN